MNSNLLYHFTRKIIIRLVSWLMERLEKLSVEGTSDSMFRLLPSWNQMISNLKPSTAQIETELCKSAQSLLFKVLPPESWNLIPSLEKNSVPVVNTWVYQNKIQQWDINPDDLVLDIGFGGFPFNRANHLADRYPGKTSHRMEKIAIDQRPFAQVDIENLPYDKKAYDFVFCSHVLEHLNNPGKAIREIVRIGNRGYIELPTRLSDIMFNFTRLPDHHRWHGLVQDKTLMLIEWSDWERRDLGNQYFDLLHSEYKNGFQEFFEKNRDLFFASYHWDGEIDFLVIDKQGVIIDSSGSRI